MDIRGGENLGALFNFSVVKKCLFCIFPTVPSGSKINPDTIDLFPRYAKKNFGYDTGCSVV